MPPADNPFVEDGGADQQVGEVTIGYTLAGLQTLKARLAFSFFILSLLLATLTAILYWRLSRAIRAPLRQVLHVAGEVSRGHLELRADGGHLLETATLARAFNDMLDALQRQRRELKEAQEVLARQRALAEVGKFSLTVAHEIKNPLAVIKGSIGILKKDGPVDPVMKQRLAGYLDEEIARINQLVEDFLIFARPRPPAFKQVPVGELLDSLTHRMQLMEPHIRIRNGVAPPSAAISVPCDPALLERSLLNLVRNALEAATAPPSVCVAFGLRRATLTLAVADDGPGFGGTDIDTLFEPFFSTKAKGTGLGLAIAREIVHAHGGTLNAAPRRTRGARFRIDLPLDPPGRPPP
jgi:signal transduction histidine kinase